MCVTHHTPFQSKQGFIYSMTSKQSKAVYIEREKQVNSNPNNRPHQSAKTSGANNITVSDQSELG